MRLYTKYEDGQGKRRWRTLLPGVSHQVNGHGRNTLSQGDSAALATKTRKATASQNDFISKRRARHGRPPKPHTTELLLFCIEEREKGESLGQILKASYDIFGKRAPQTEADVSKYASRWKRLSDQEKKYRLEQLKDWKNSQRQGG
jgi:hypothetical protein